VLFGTPALASGCGLLCVDGVRDVAAAAGTAEHDHHGRSGSDAGSAAESHEHRGHAAQSHHTQAGGQNDGNGSALVGGLPAHCCDLASGSPALTAARPHTPALPTAAPHPSLSGADHLPRGGASAGRTPPRFALVSSPARSPLVLRI
jgi:hypothetical protein